MGGRVVAMVKNSINMDEKRYIQSIAAKTVICPLI